METIPLIESAGRTPHDIATAMPASTAANEPLAVETLEDRVLPASDAMPNAPSAVPPAEPAPYVASEHTPRSAIDLESVADIADTAGIQHPSAASGAQPSTPHSAHGEAEFVENRLETVEKSAPQNDVLSEAEPNQNEFGLATIEPETGASDLVKSSRDRGSFKKLVAEGSVIGENGAAQSASSGDPLATETASAAVEIAVQEVVAEINTGLVKTVAIEPRIEPGSPQVDSGKSVEASRASDPSDVLVQAVLKVGPVAPATTAPEEEPHTDKADFGLLEPNLEQPPSEISSESDTARLDGPPQRSEVLAGVPAETASAAHDALFEGGSGVEVVLAPPSNA